MCDYSLFPLSLLAIIVVVVVVIVIIIIIIVNYYHYKSGNEYIKSRKKGLKE